MKTISFAVFVTLSLFLLAAGIAAADDYSSTITEFKKAPETKKFFESAYGYAVSPKIGKGGLGVGIAYGNGQAYRQGAVTGSSEMSQGSIGFQAG